MKNRHLRVMCALVDVGVGAIVNASVGGDADGAVQGSHDLRPIADATMDDVVQVPSILRTFHSWMLDGNCHASELTCREYVKAVRRCFSQGHKSPAGVASETYLDSLKDGRLRQRCITSSAVRRFKLFGEKTIKVLSNRRLGRRCTRCRRGGVV